MIGSARAHNVTALYCARYKTVSISPRTCFSLNDFHLRAFPRQLAAKQAAAAATQTIAAAQNAAASNKNTVSHQQLVHSCKVTQIIVISPLKKV